MNQLKPVHQHLICKVKNSSFLKIKGGWYAFGKTLTHWGRDKMTAISQTTLSIAFSRVKMLEFWLNFH